MLEIMNYIKARYLGEKAQGITEYALILLFVVAVATAVLWASGSDGALMTGLKGAFNKVANTLNSH